MPRIVYTNKRFSADVLDIIETADEILTSYADEGYEVTLRQLYYQFVARDLLPNTDASYKRLGSIIADARMAGYIDWNHLVDRGRFLREVSTWDDAEDIVLSCVHHFKTDWWQDQPRYVEVWIEKDALVGVIERPCNSLRVPAFSCRGYTSASSMWEAAQRVGRKFMDGKAVTILHLGDHDPSGIDMTRDIRDRLQHFLNVDIGYQSDFAVKRIALTMEQVEHWNPPPNPAKLSDARARDYISRYGLSSWEVDALTPETLTSLVSNEVLAHVDMAAWEDSQRLEHAGRADLERAADWLSENSGRDV